jgi:hypothetical protein
MDTQPRKPDEKDRDEPSPLVPEIEDADKAAENIKEKGEPFDSNLA